MVICDSSPEKLIHCPGEVEEQGEEGKGPHEEATFVCLSCHTRLPRAWWFKQQAFIFSFWRLEVHIKMLASWVSALFLASLCGLSLRMLGEGEFWFSSSSYKDNRSTRT